MILESSLIVLGATQFPTPYEAMAGRPTAVRDSGITSCDSGLDIEAG